jgi:NhaP-type Na+/H+ and K+/H+ antiporter
LPGSAAVLLVIREDEMLAPRDELELRLGDHVYVLCQRRDHSLLHLLFGDEDEKP